MDGPETAPTAGETIWPAMRLSKITGAVVEAILRWLASGFDPTLADLHASVDVSPRQLVVHQGVLEGAESIGSIVRRTGKQSRADLRRSGGVLITVSPIEILCSGLIPL